MARGLFRLEPNLNCIWEYIAKDNPDAAGQVRDEIVSGIEALIPFPHRGHARPDLTARPLRFIVVREYLIAYAPDEKPLWVVAVIHGGAARAWLPRFSEDESSRATQALQGRGRPPLRIPS